MIRLKKKGLILFISILVVAVVGIGGYFVSKNAMKAWDDASTWATDDKIQLPVQATSNYKITTKEKDGVFHISIPFCVLFDVAVKTESKLEYYCAAIPYSSQQLAIHLPDKFKLQKDIVVSFNADVDALPTSFLGYLTIDKEALNTIGSESKPVSIDMQVSYQKPSKNVLSLLSHYQMSKSGKKESYVSMKVTEWSVNKVKLANEYSTAQKKEVIEAWRTQAWNDMNKLLKTGDYLNMANSKDMMIETAKWMVFRNMYCPTAQVKEECELGYEENASTNLIYYTYASSKLDKKRFDRLTSVFRERMMPFVLESNPEIVEYYLNCDTATECNYFHRLEAYDYPACPILELGKTETTDIARLFIDFRSPTLGDDYAKMDFSKVGMLNKITSMRKEFTTSKNLRTLSYTSIQDFDRLCYKMLKDKVVDAEVTSSMQSFYMQNFLGQLAIEEKDYVNVNMDAALFDLVLQSSKLNPFNYSAVPHPMLTYQRVVTGVQKQDNSTPADGYWASLNSTMILLYLTSKY